MGRSTVAAAPACGWDRAAATSRRHPEAPDVRVAPDGRRAGAVVRAGRVLAGARRAPANAPCGRPVVPAADQAESGGLGAAPRARQVRAGARPVGAVVRAGPVHAAAADRRMARDVRSVVRDVRRVVRDDRPGVRDDRPEVRAAGPAAGVHGARTGPPVGAAPRAVAVDGRRVAGRGDLRGRPGGGRAGECGPVARAAAPTAAAPAGAGSVPRTGVAVGCGWAVRRRGGRAPRAVSAARWVRSSALRIRCATTGTHRTMVTANLSASRHVVGHNRDTRTPTRRPHPDMPGDTPTRLPHGVREAGSRTWVPEAPTGRRGRAGRGIGARGGARRARAAGRRRTR